MSLYNGTEFYRSLLQFKNGIPFILHNYFFYPPDNTNKKNDEAAQPYKHTRNYLKILLDKIAREYRHVLYIEN
jgi:hypothetical protein